MDKQETMELYDKTLDMLAYWMKAVAHTKDAYPTDLEASPSLIGRDLVRLSKVLNALEEASAALRKGYKDFSGFLTEADSTA